MKLITHLSWLLRALLFLAVFAFALMNTDAVKLRFFLGQTWETPMIVALLVSFACGPGRGATACLSRRSGEAERAIRMHRNLLERPDLGAEQRLHAMVELGQDYLKAGLLDRAEEMFLKLRGSPHRAEALKFLLEIYQQEKDWMKAVGIALELEKDSGQSSQKEIANYYCELALSEVTHSRPDGARHRLEAALAAHRKCVRANIILGDVAAASGDHVGAIEAWKRIEQQNPTYLALVAQRLP